MKQITPLEKQSKKAKRAYYAQQRGSWNGVNPVTKVVPSAKAYNRKKNRSESLRDFGDEKGWFAFLLDISAALFLFFSDKMPYNEQL